MCSNIIALSYIYSSWIGKEPCAFGSPFHECTKISDMKHAQKQKISIHKLCRTKLFGLYYASVCGWATNLLVFLTWWNRQFIKSWDSKEPIKTHKCSPAYLTEWKLVMAPLMCTKYSVITSFIPLVLFLTHFNRLWPPRLGLGWK